MLGLAAIAASASLATTGASYALSVDGVHHWLPELQVMGIAKVRGFPLPYAAYYPSNGAARVFYPLNLAGDLSFWFAIALLALSAFTRWRLVLALLGGLGVTLLSLLLPPLAMATPLDAPLVCFPSPMGFPFEYLSRLDCGPFGGVTTQFSLVNAAADLAFWTGATFAAFGFVLFLAYSLRRQGVQKFSGEVAISVQVAIVLIAALTTGSEYVSPSCSALGVTFSDLPASGPGVQYSCGRGTVSDGRLSITLNNYHFAEGASIEGVGGQGVYLLVNATVENLGDGGAHMWNYFSVTLTNGTAPAADFSARNPSAVFPGQFPNTSAPASPAELPPHSSATYWFLFGSESAVSLNGTRNVKLKQMVWHEYDYGEVMSEYGQWECGQCTDLQTRVLVLD